MPQNPQNMSLLVFIPISTAQLEKFSTKYYITVNIISKISELKNMSC